MAVKSSQLFPSLEASADLLTVGSPVDEPTNRSPLLLALGCAAWLFCACISTLFLLQIDASVNAQIPFAAVLVFIAGVLLAFVCAWPLKLHVALRNLLLGPWLAMAFSVVFGLATPVWLLEARYQSIAVSYTHLTLPTSDLV